MRKADTKYLASIDAMRAIAILLMIQVHFVNNLSPRQASSAALFDLSSDLGSLPAPIFSFLAGLSLWLWLSKEAGRDAAETRQIVYRRGFFLFATGLAFATFIWLPVSIFDWDILTFLGAATIAAYLARKLSPWKIVAIIILILLVSPPLREASGYASHWREDEYLYEFTLRDAVFGFLLEGYFPILPWIVFPLLGLIVGKTWLDGENPSRMSGWSLPLTGLSLIVLAGIGIGVGAALPSRWEFYFSEATFYPASTTFLIGCMGILLLALWSLHAALDSRPVGSDAAAMKFLRRYSRFSLTAYIVHHAVHVWPLYLLAAWEGRDDPWWYYADAVDTPAALLLAWLFIVVFYGVLIRWEKKSEYSFEGLLRWFSAP